MSEKVLPRRQTMYREEVIPALEKEFGYKNVNAVPILTKISVNMGVGRATQNSKLLEAAVEDMKIITGQKPVIRSSKKAISNFKLRENIPIGCSVTLRGEKMWEFLDRLISIAIPRVRDFRGVPTKSFDGHGNYTLGLTEQIIFPEIDYDKMDALRGMNITFVTTARRDEEAMGLLRLLGMPFRK